MKTKLLSLFLVATSALALGARAQQVTVPTPAPVVDGVNPAVIAQSPAPSRIIYSPRLPSPTELSNVAAAQGLGIERIDQTAEQITVVYRKANGQLTTVAYQLLGSAAPYSNVGTTTVVTTPAPTVVYESREPVYYYNDPYYYPWGYYSPVSLSLGFGYYHGFGGYHGGYRGGFHGGHRRW